MLRNVALGALQRKTCNAYPKNKGLRLPIAPVPAKLSALRLLVESVCAVYSISFLSLCNGFIRSNPDPRNSVQILLDNPYVTHGTFAPAVARNAVNPAANAIPTLPPHWAARSTSKRFK